MTIQFRRPLLLAAVPLLLAAALPASALAQPAGVGAGGADGPVATNLPQAPVELSYGEITVTIRPWIERLVSVRAVLAVPGDESLLRVIADRDYTVSLATLRSRLNTPGVVRAQEFGSFVGALERTLQANDPFKPDALRVIIRPTGVVDDFELMTTVAGARNRVVRRAFAPGLEEVVVGDTGTSIAYLPQRRLQDLQLAGDAAFELGRSNLVAIARQASWADEDGLRIATLDGVFEPSLLAVDGLWEQLAADMGGPLAVAIPRRGRLLVARLDDAAALERLRAAVRAEAVGEQALSTLILQRSGQGWQPVP